MKKIKIQKSSRVKETETSHLHMNKNQSLVKLPVCLSFKQKKVRIEDIFGHARNYFTFSANLLRSYSGMLQPWTKKGKTMEPRRQWFSQKNNKGWSLDDSCAIALESSRSSKELKVRFQKEPPSPAPPKKMKCKRCDILLENLEHLKGVTKIKKKCKEKERQPETPGEN